MPFPVFKTSYQRREEREKSKINIRCRTLKTDDRPLIFNVKEKKKKPVSDAAISKACTIATRTKEENVEAEFKTEINFKEYARLHVRDKSVKGEKGMKE